MTIHPLFPTAETARPTTTETDRSRARTRAAIRTVVGLIPLFVHSSACAAAALPIALLGVWGAPLAAPFYALAAVCCAGLIGRATRQHVVAGRFVRDLSTPEYRGRAIYGAAWTSLFYCRPLYHAVLLCRPLKALALRSFGYRGSLEMTTYPDTWIRDLTLLEVGEGAYLSNRATLGTNIVRGEGILVDRIRVGAGSTVGHLAKVAPGASIGAGSEIGVGSALGIRVELGDGVTIGPETVIDHGTTFGDRARIGIRSYVGKRCVIGAGVRLPAGVFVPDRTQLLTQDDADAFVADTSTSRTRKTEETAA